ncbi:MAG: Hsp20/alpha crystallin family protein [Tissierellia bacterium]|nr:Hsp20/alpha crystallin family protein [Tissierellia bacterium]
MFGMTPYRGRKSLARRRWMDLDDMFDNMVDYMFNNIFNEKGYNLLAHSPMKVDIKEYEDKYLLEAELPGVNKEDINVEIRDDILTIWVERKEEIKEERENYIRRERRYGSLRRSFPVDDVEQDKIEARFENGILYLDLPKRKDARDKVNRIQIR